MQAEPVEISIDTDQTLDTMLHQILNQALVAIGAEAGSLMLVANKRDILQIKARLGRPRAGRKSEPIYRISGRSIAATVVSTKESYICNNVEADDNFYPSRHGKTFSSLLSVPVINDDKVIAVINADSNERDFFNESHRQQLEAVAKSVAQPLAERISILDALGAVGMELSRLPRGGVEHVLKRIAQLAVRSLGADVVTIYPYDQERDHFPVEGTGPTIYPGVEQPEHMQTAVFPGDVPWIVVHKRRPGFYPDVHQVDFLTRDIEREGQKPRPRFIVREGIESMAALLLPYRAAQSIDEEIVGVMFANYRTHHDFNIDEQSALASFADYAATAILNARLVARQQQEQLEAEERRRAEQMQMVKSISAHFAHRMVNVAGIGRLNVDELREHIVQDDVEAHILLDEIQQESEILLGLAERLVRPYMKTGQLLELVPLALPKLIAEEIQRINPDPSRITVTVDMPPDLPLVLSAEFQLREVFHDMISNAVEAMAAQESGELTIRARHNQKHGQVELQIADNGPGIPELIRGSLFEPGVTTKKNSLGIGLWWCRTFMQATKGDVVLLNTWPGGGTVFAILIPCLADEEQESTDQATPHYRPRKKRPIDLLIVEDNDKWRNKLERYVQAPGVSIHGAATYEEAYRLLQTNQYKLIIADLLLDEARPDYYEGMKLLADVEELQRYAKVIIVSGHDQAELVENARHSPRLLAYLSKSSLRKAELRELVLYCIEQSEKKPS